MRCTLKSWATSSFHKSSGHGFSHAEATVAHARALAPEVCPSAAEAARKGNWVAPVTARLKSCPEGPPKRLTIVLNLFMPVILLAACAARAQMPTYSNVGRTPTAEEIRAWDFAIGVDGKELPPGKGTAKDGAPIYARKCARCHGATGEEGPLMRLVGGKGTLTSMTPLRTVGSYWAFATTVWDYINRAMPPDEERSFTADEVYALTAFLLYRNGIIAESDVMDAKTLPKVQMPNRNGFIPQRIEEIPDARKRGCRLGHCP